MESTAASPSNATAVPSPHTASRWRTGDYLVRVVVPIYVAAGAVLKVFTGSPFVLPNFMVNRSETLPLTRIFLVAVAVEATLAAVMFLHPRLARPAAITILSVFLAVISWQMVDTAKILRKTDQTFTQSLVHTLTHETESCGCFGAVKPPIQAVLAADLLLLAGAIFFPRRRPQPEIPTPRLHILCGLSIPLLVIPFILYRTDRLSFHDVQFWTWRGQPWKNTPLAKWLPIGPDNFTESEQTWVLYKKSCPTCHGYFTMLYKEPTKDRVIAVEVPDAPGRTFSMHDGKPWGDVDCPSCIRTALPGGKEWFVITPIVVKVVNGTIVSSERVLDLSKLQKGVDRADESATVQDPNMGRYPLTPTPPTQPPPNP